MSIICHPGPGTCLRLSVGSVGMQVPGYQLAQWCTATVPGDIRISPDSLPQWKLKNAVANGTSDTSIYF